MTTGQEHFVAAGRADRLGARLKNLLSAWSFARSIGEPLVLNWDPYSKQDNTEFLFFDLFSEKADWSKAGLFEVDSRSRMLFLRDLRKIGFIDIDQNKNNPLDFFKTRDVPAVWYGASAQYKKKDTAESSVAPSSSALFNLLPINEDIMSVISKIEESWNIRDTVCVHIRRGDMVNGFADIGPDSVPQKRERFLNNFYMRYAPRSAYMAAINAIDIEKKVILFSDDIIERNHISEICSKRVIDIHSTLDKASLTTLQRAFCEFLILSRASEIICAKSAFSRFSAEIGNAKVRPISEFVTAEDVISDMRDMTQGMANQSDIIEMALAHYKID